MNGYTQILALLSMFVLTGPTQAAETLRVLAWPGYVSKEAIASFEQQHAASVELVEINSDNDLWQRTQANQGDDFDLVAINTAELSRYIDADLVSPIRISNIPNTRLQARRFRQYKEIPGLVRADEIYGIPYTYSAMGLIYNRQLVSTAPKSMNALWDPKYKGRILLYNGSDHNFSLTALALGIHQPFQLDKPQFAQVVQRLLKLRGHIPTLYATPDEVVQAFQEPLPPALVFANYGDQQHRLLKKAGFDIGYVIPEEGALAWLDCWAIMRHASNRRLAEAWINHMLSREVSLAFTLREGLANTLQEGTALTTTQRTDKLVWLEPVENSDQRARYWERLMAGAARFH